MRWYIHQKNYNAAIWNVYENPMSTGVLCVCVCGDKLKNSLTYAKQMFSIKWVLQWVRYYIKTDKT